MTQSALTLVDEASPNPSAHNAAVQRCCAARERSLQQSRAQQCEHFKAKECADEAYRDAMPDLSGYENIRDFIACITHGMICGSIHQIDGPKLLYAAQVAVCALRQEPKEPKRPAA
jgi:hypothetical protein